MDIADDNEPWWHAAGPGGWNDPGAPGSPAPDAARPAPPITHLSCPRPLTPSLRAISPDMLEIGNGKLTEDEERAHFSLWALMKAPLLIGCDVANIPPDSFDVLTNAEARRRFRFAPLYCLAAGWRAGCGGRSGGRPCGLYVSVLY